MSFTEPTAADHCPECGAALRNPADRQCWLCRADLQRPRQPSLAPPPIPTNPRPTFALSSLLLIITLIAVCLGVLREAPGLGIPLVIIVVPALIRTFAATGRQRAAGQSLSTGERIASFFRSAGVVFLIVLAGFIAFQAACWLTCGGAVLVGSEGLVFAGMIGGGILGVVLILVLLIRTWPR